MPTRVLIDSCAIIDHMRAPDKKKSFLANTLRRYDSIYASTISEFEVLNGMTALYRECWKSLVDRLAFVSVDRRSVAVASRIHRELKSKRMQIDLADLFIAATAVAYGLPLATMNRKHFDRIDCLKLVLPE